MNARTLFCRFLIPILYIGFALGIASPVYYEPEDMTANFECVGTYFSNKPVTQAKISGSRAYSVAAGREVVCLDIANVKHPRVLGRDLQTTYTTIMTLQGDRLFLSNLNAGFHVLDFSNPKSPKPLGDYREGVGPMCISGSHLYMVQDGLKILDISNLASIRSVGYFKTDSPAVDLATSGTMVFLLTNDAINAIEAKDPAKPVLTGKIGNPSPDEVHVYGDCKWQCLKRLHSALYVISGGSQNGSLDDCMYDVIDITNPSSMGLVKQAMEDTDSGKGAPAVLPANPKAEYPGWYLCLPFRYETRGPGHEPSGLKMYDCSEPLHPRYAGCYDHESDSSQALLYKDTIYLTKYIYSPDGKDKGSFLILRHIAADSAKTAKQ